MIIITPTLSLDETKLKWAFIRAQGPGGQNVNKVATAVQLRFDSNTLPEDMQWRLKTLAGKRLTKSGELIILAQRFRTQEMNREDALQKLVTLLKQAATKPKKRRKTKPTKASKKARLDSKRKAGTLKKLRRKPAGENH